MLRIPAALEWKSRSIPHLADRSDGFLPALPSCLGPFSHIRRSLGFPYRHSLLRTPRTSSHLPCCCFFVGIAVVDRPLYGELQRSVSSGYRLSSICCPHFRFHLQMATTSAGALASLRHSIYFSWHGRLLEGRMHPCVRRTGLQIRWRGVGGIRSRCSTARVPHWLFDMET